MKIIRRIEIGAVKKAQQSPWIPSIWKPTGFNISHSKKELSNLEKRVQQTQRQKNCVFAVLKMWKIFLIYAAFFIAGFFKWNL